ncbi:TPA: invasin domain 3-containing protein [Enterobacter cloacae]
MNKIPFALGRAAGVAAREQQPDTSFENSARGQAVFAGLLPAKRGKPFTVISINADDYLQKLGDPIHPRLGDAFEPIRHVAQAVAGGRGHVVRVCPPDMRIPILRVKELATPPLPQSALVSGTRSVMGTSSTKLVADGNDTITLSFTAKDDKGNLLLGMKDVFFTAIGTYPPTIGDTYEVNGTYYADVTATRSDSTLILVMQNNQRLGQFTVQIDVLPAIVDPDNSTLEVDKPVIDNDDIAAATIKLTAKDDNGQPVIGMTNIDFIVNGSASVNMTPAVETSPGVYETKLSGHSPGTLTVIPRQNGQELKPLGVDVLLLDVITGVPVNIPTSNFNISSASIYGDNRDETVLTFTATDDKGHVIKGLNKLRFDVAFNTPGTKAYTLSPIQEVQSGTYRATFKTTDFGKVTITPYDDQRLLSLPLHSNVRTIDVTQVIPVDAGKTTMTTDKPRIVYDGKDRAAITLTVRDAAGAVITTGTRGLSFDLVSGTGTITQPTEVKPGIWTGYLVSKMSGDVVVKASQYGTQIGTQQVTIFSAPVPKLTEGTSKLLLTPDSIQANDTDVIKVSFTARDSVNKPMENLTTLTLKLSGVQGTKVGRLTHAGKGVYEAELTGSQIGSGTVAVLENGTQFGLPEPFTVLPVHGKVDTDKSLLELLDKSNAPINEIKANNQETLTIKVTLVDGYNDPVTGRVAIQVSMDGIAGFPIVALKEAVAGSGVYTGEVKTLLDGTAQVAIYDGSVKLTGPRVTRAFNFKLVRGIMDVTLSHFRIGASPIYNNNKDQCILTYIALDGISQPVLGLRDISFGMDGKGVSIGATSYNSLGEYTAVLTSSVSQTFNVFPTRNGTRIDSFNEQLTVRDAPVVAKSASSFIANGSLVADDQPTLTLEVHLIDQYGQNFDMSTLTLRQAGMTGLTIHPQVYDAATHTATYEVSGATRFATAGTITLADAAGKDLGMDPVSFNVDPAPGVVDPDYTKLLIAPNNLDGDGIKTATVTINLRDGYNNPIVGKKDDLRLVPAGAISFSNFTEIANGVYTCSASSTRPGLVTFVATLNYVTIGTAATHTATITFNDVSNVISATGSSLTLDVSEIYDNGISKANLTLHLKNQLLNDLGGKDVKFRAYLNGVLTTDVSIPDAHTYTTGTYISEVTATRSAQYVIVPVIDNVERKDITATIDVNDTPVFTPLNSAIIPDALTVIANGSDVVELKLYAVDQYAEAMIGVNGFEFLISPAGAGTIDRVPTDNGDGTYSADLQLGVIGRVTVSVNYNGSDSGVTPVVIEGKPIHGQIDEQLSSLTIDKHLILGNGKDGAIATFTALDGYGDPVLGLSPTQLISVPAAIMGGKITTVSPTTTPGVYAVLVQSLGSGTGTISVNNPHTGAVIRGMTQDLTVTDMHGIIDAGMSRFSATQQSITAILSDRSYVPATSDTKYSTVVTLTAKDLFDAPLPGIEFGVGDTLEFYLAPGSVNAQIAYIGEGTDANGSANGQYSAKVFTKTSGTIKIGLKINGVENPAYTPVEITVASAPEIDWVNSTLMDNSNGTIEYTGSDTPFTLSLKVIDTDGDMVSGLSANDLAIALQAGSVDAAKVASTGLGTVTNFHEISAGVWEGTITAKSILEEYMPLYLAQWKGVDKPDALTTMIIEPHRAEFVFDKSDFTVSKLTVDDNGVDGIKLDLVPRNWYGENVHFIYAQEVEFFASLPDGSAVPYVHISGSTFEEINGEYHYTATLTATEVGSFNVEVVYQKVKRGDINANLEKAVSSIPTILDAGKSQIEFRSAYGAITNLTMSVDYAPTSIQIRAKDEYGRVLDGIANDLSLDITGDTLQVVGAFVEAPLGTYTAPVTANRSVWTLADQGNVTFSVKQGGKDTGLSGKLELRVLANFLPDMTKSTATLTAATAYINVSSSEVVIKLNSPMTALTGKTTNLKARVTGGTGRVTIEATRESAVGEYHINLVPLTAGPVTIVPYYTSGMLEIAFPALTLTVSDRQRVSSLNSRLFNPATNTVIANRPNNAVYENETVLVALTLKDVNNSVITGWAGNLQLQGTDIPQGAGEQSVIEAPAGTYTFTFKMLGRAVSGSQQSMEVIDTSPAANALPDKGKTGIKNQYIMLLMPDTKQSTTNFSLLCVAKDSTSRYTFGLKDKNGTIINARQYDIGAVTFAATNGALGLPREAGAKTIGDASNAGSVSGNLQMPTSPNNSLDGKTFQLGLVVNGVEAIVASQNVGQLRADNRYTGIITITPFGIDPYLSVVNIGAESATIIKGTAFTTEAKGKVKLKFDANTSAGAVIVNPGLTSAGVTIEFVPRIVSGPSVAFDLSAAPAITYASASKVVRITTAVTQDVVIEWGIKINGWTAVVNTKNLATWTAVALQDFSKSVIRGSNNTLAAIQAPINVAQDLSVTLLDASSKEVSSPQQCQIKITDVNGTPVSASVASISNDVVRYGTVIANVTFKKTGDYYVTVYSKGVEVVPAAGRLKVTAYTPTAGLTFSPEHSGWGYGTQVNKTQMVMGQKYTIGLNLRKDDFSTLDPLPDIRFLLRLASTKAGVGFVTSATGAAATANIIVATKPTIIKGMYSIELTMRQAGEFTLTPMFNINGVYIEVPELATEFTVIDMTNLPIKWEHDKTKLEVLHGTTEVGINAYPAVNSGKEPIDIRFYAYNQYGVPLSGANKLSVTITGGTAGVDYVAQVQTNLNRPDYHFIRAYFYKAGSYVITPVYNGVASPGKARTIKVNADLEWPTPAGTHALYLDLSSTAFADRIAIGENPIFYTIMTNSKYLKGIDPTGKNCTLESSNTAVIQVTKQPTKFVNGNQDTYAQMALKAIAKGTATLTYKVNGVVFKTLTLTVYSAADVAKGVILYYRRMSAAVYRCYAVVVNIPVVAATRYALANSVYSGPGTSIPIPTVPATSWTGAGGWATTPTYEAIPTDAIGPGNVKIGIAAKGWRWEMKITKAGKLIWRAMLKVGTTTYYSQPLTVDMSLSDEYEFIDGGIFEPLYIEKSKSEFTAALMSAAGGRKEFLIRFMARDQHGAPMAHIHGLTFKPGNPLVTVGDVYDHGDGSYTAVATTNETDLTTAVEVWLDFETGSGIKLVLDVKPDQVIDTSWHEKMPPTPWYNSPATIYPLHAPADGKSELVCTLILLDQYGDKMAGQNVALVAQPGSVGTLNSVVEEIEPGIYRATIRSHNSGPALSGWTVDGHLVTASPRGAFSRVVLDVAPAEEDDQDMPPMAPPVPLAAAPVYINVIPDTLGINEEVTLEADDLMVLAVNDGDDSQNRTVSIEPDKTYPAMWNFGLSEINNMGVASTLEFLRFSLNPNMMDPTGQTVWLPQVLEDNDSRVRAYIRDARTGEEFANFPTTFTGFSDVLFVGGTGGTLASITYDDYAAALKALEASVVNYTAVLSLGCYDMNVLNALAVHAREVRVDMFMDAPPSYYPSDAANFTERLGFSEFPHVTVYHFPYSSKDIYTGEQITFGLSGDAFTSKARGVVQVQGIGGWHFSPAGNARGTVLRKNVQPLPSAAGIDRERYVNSRLNTVAPSMTGLMQIDDSLTTYKHEDGQQYQHVSSVLNALARDLNDICMVIKHEPGDDPLTALNREIPLLLNEYVRCGALVPPRDTTQGLSPYVFEVLNTDFDSWHVRYAVCVVGTARRIICEPVIYR